ncbi:MAG: hypothetical protein J7623_04920 [Chitinophaga sp.]|uniref:hypothetical protein n=1 Tax=Chitinophaga sp. TaxID=1869181 RepID=UPI001B138CE1|nr:hypothetical protein [Chitinophaga sp.]MBO9727960.1 hypothetical protein [Chitinophaga sp.]
MNKTTPYEDLIAAKLEQMPVPDMADAIWDNIAMQLDAGVDIPEAKPTPKPKYGGKAGFGIIGAIIIAALIYWYYHTKHQTPANTTTPKAPPAIEKTAPAIDSAAVNDHNTGKKNAPLLPVIIKKNSAFSPVHVPDSVRVDSIATPPLTPEKIDSFVSSHQKTPERVFDSIYQMPVRKRPKGVKGIKPDDYRLDVNKDSIPKKQ